MLKPLQSFFQTQTPTKQQALNVLRGLFASMFLVQALIALTLTLILFLTNERQSASPLTSQILLLFALFQLPLGVSLPILAANTGGKVAALSATLLTAVLLSTPSWFTAFALLIGSPSNYLIAMLAIVMISYSAGFIMCNRYAQTALLEPQQNPPSQPPDTDNPA